MSQQTKITVKIYAPLLKAFDDQLERLFIKRDAFLNHMIKSEVAELAREMQNLRLSNAARRYVAGQLKRMGTKTINVSVDKATADSLNAVVDRTNMVRDAFVNRLVMLLRSSDSLLLHLGLPRLIVRNEFRRSSYEEMPTSPLSAMEAVLQDPMHYLRLAADERYDSGLYRLSLPDKLVGFSCFLDDAEVPGMKERAEATNLGETLLKELEEFESDAFSNAGSAQSNGRGIK